MLLACSPILNKEVSCAGIRPGSGWDHPWLEARTLDSVDSKANAACLRMQGLVGHGTNALDLGLF